MELACNFMRQDFLACMNVNISRVGTALSVSFHFWKRTCTPGLVKLMNMDTSRIALEAYHQSETVPSKLSVCILNHFIRCNEGDSLNMPSTKFIQMAAVGPFTL